MAHHHHHFRVWMNLNTVLLLVHQEILSFLRSLFFLANSQFSLEHRIPVPNLRRQSEHSIQSHVIYNHAVLLPLSHSQSSSHHLQVLGKRQCRSSQLYKLHIRAVKSLREYVHIHQHLYRSKPISSPQASSTQSIANSISSPQASSTQAITCSQASISKAVPSRTIWRDL